MLNKVQGLADSGQHAAVVEYLRERDVVEIENSPTLALLYGVAQARLGSHESGERWVGLALKRSEERGDHTIKARALNVSGAIAFESGRIDDAASFFTRALAAAERESDHATVGRCSNNLGIIANLRGDTGRAVGSYTMALAAFQQAGLQVGIAETLHNLAITYRDRGELDKALETADQAVAEAQAAGDRALAAQTRGGRAEIRLIAGDVAMAKHEVERALELHREVGNVAGEADDLRVLGRILAAQDERAEAERLFREVIAQAEEHNRPYRPLSVAQAERDLVSLLLKNGRDAEAREVARTARVRFKQLSAEAEVEKLDQLLGE